MVNLPPLYLILFSSLIFTLPTSQVSITLSLQAGASPPNTATCTDIPPGLCCRFPSIGIDASVVTFSHLTAFDIAAIWEYSANMHVPPTTKGGDCSGRVLRSRTGPGNWRWTSETGLTGDRATGGSYVTLPRSLPPGIEDKEWMAVEGLLALAWGGVQWFASPAAQKLLRGSGRRGGVPPRSRSRRDIRSDEKGEVVARSPNDGILPDRIKWNETAFMLYNEADMIYKNDEVGLVNLTTLFEVDSD